MKLKFLAVFHSMAFRISCYVALVVSFVMILAMSIISRMAEEGLMRDANEKTEGSLRAIVGDISQILEQAETSTRNYDYMILDYLDNKPESLPLIPTYMVEKNVWLEGSTLAIEKGKINNGLFAPFAYRDSTGTIRQIPLLYDYTAHDWFKKTYTSGKDYWGEPFSMSGKHCMITIYSHAVVRPKTNKIEAIFCADVSLEKLKNLINEKLPFDGCKAFVISREGNYIVHPNNEFVLRKNISQQPIFTSGLSKTMEDSVNRMLENENKGYIDLTLRNGNDKNFADGNYSVYQCPIEKTGWLLVMVCPQSVVFAGVNVMLTHLRNYFLLCIIVLLISTTLLILRALRPLRKFTTAVEDVARGNYNTILPQIKTRDELYNFRNAFSAMQLSLVENINELTRTASEQSRIENELKIAKEIQQNLLSKAFSPYIDWPSLDVYALLESAREVGGDLYDFFIRDRKLFFCVGDVSGKGVPAALFMAVTRGLFRVIAHSEDSPSTIITRINHTLAAENPQNMFVTMLCGCLDLDNWHLHLANAGHNPPIRICGEKAEYVSVLPAVPLGFFEDTRYCESEVNLSKGETLVVYTDGVTEAENDDKELYGEMRLLEFAKNNKTTNAKELLLSLHEDVKKFTNGAEQSDDLTIFCMKRIEDEDSSEYIKYIDFTNDIQQVEKLNPFLTEIQKDLNINEGLMTQLNLAVEEALVNIMKYAYPKGEIGQIRLTVESQTSCRSLRFILVDYGIAFDPTSAKKADVEADVLDRPIGGLGIFLVQNIMTTVEYTRRNQSNILLMIKNLD